MSDCGVTISLSICEFLLEIQRKRFILELNEEILNKCVIHTSQRILLINLKFGAFHCIEEQNNVIIELSNRELLGFPNFSIHIDLVMRTKTPKDQSNDG
jgi:hypothetical protein